MGRFRSLIGASAVALAGMVAGFAGAQTTANLAMTGLGNQTGQTEAQTFVSQQGGTLNTAATAGNTSIVAGSTADTSAYQGLASNPSGMAAAGQTAGAADGNVGTVSGAYANQDSTTVSASDPWYQSSLSSTAAQSSNLATTGAPQQTCQTTQTQSQVTTNDGLYTCDSTEQVTDTPGTCVQNLVVSTSTTDLYDCQNTYNQTTKQWVTSPACAALTAAGQCTSTGSTCTAPANPYFQATQCTAGTEWTSTPQTCSETRDVVVGADYNYACANTYDPATQSWTTSAACAALAANRACQQQGQSCTTPTPPLTKTCQQGTEASSDTQTCDPTLQVTVGTHYVYSADKSWDGSTYVPSAQESALISASASGACQLQATNCTADYPAQTYSCESGTATTATTSVWYGLGLYDALYANNTVVPAKVTGKYVYLCTAYPGLETCGEYTAASGCTSTLLLDARIGTYPYSAANTEPTEAQADVAGSYPTYEIACSSAVEPSDPSFSTPLVSTSASGTKAPSGYYWLSLITPPQETESNCTEVSYGCDSNGYGFVWYGRSASGNNDLTATAVDGYDGPENFAGCLRSQITFSCTSTTTAAGCSPPAGYSQTASACAATNSQGACTETNQTWTLAGGCSSYTDQWLCNADIPAADPYQSIQHYVASTAWSNACQALEGNSACSLASTTVTQGPSTQTIDGLAVYETAWAEQNTYSCATTAPVDTCTGAVSGCSQTAATCAQPGPRGSCALWTYTYACPDNDGSGGCEQTSLTYQCTADVPAADPALSTSPYLISANWTTGCQALAANGACTLTTDQTDGTATQVIDGLSVTETGWNKTDIYSCWASQPINGCAGNVTGCSQTGQSCAGTDRNGACSVWTYTYSCPANDGSGGCSVKTASFTCTATTPAGADVPAADPAQSSTTVVTGTAWNQTCPQAGQSNCQAGATTCTDGPATQTINGLAVTEPCWSQTTSFTCESASAESSDCNPPAGCTHTSDTCLDNPVQPSGCVSMEHDYSCPNTTTRTSTSQTCSTQLCMGSQCFSVSGSNDSSSLSQAYTALAIGQSAGESYSNPANNLQIMPGTNNTCHKDLTGFSNCCKDAGWGQSLGLAQCSEAEQTLMQMQQAGECHYVGDYCSNTSLFGICLQRTMSYCCFQGSLARIINEAGRPQIGKVWGNPKSPDCSGFTVAQFQSLNLANVDFSEFYNQALGGLTAPDSSTASASIQNTLQQMQSGNTPSNLSTTGP